MAPTSPPATASAGLSTLDIAALLKTDRTTVWRIIRRLNLPPSIHFSRFKFYDPSVVPIIRSALKPRPSTAFPSK